MHSAVSPNIVSNHAGDGGGAGVYTHGCVSATTLHYGKISLGHFSPMVSAFQSNWYLGGERAGTRALVNSFLGFIYFMGSEFLTIGLR